MFHRICLLWRVFTQLENTVIAAVVAALPDAIRAQVRIQVEHVNKVQRLGDWVTSTLYCIKKGKVQWPVECMLSRKGVFCLAEVLFDVGGVRGSSSIWAGNGHIGSIVTRPSPKHIYMLTPRVREVHLIDARDDPALDGVSFPFVLPYGFLDYWQEPRGAHVGDLWTVLEPQECYVVHLPQGDFVLLAERAGNELLLSDVSGKRGIWKYHIGGEFIRLADHFGPDLVRSML